MDWLARAPGKVQTETIESVVWGRGCTREDLLHGVVAVPRKGGNHYNQAHFVWLWAVS